MTPEPNSFHRDSSLESSAAFLLTASNDIARDETPRNDNFNILCTLAMRGEWRRQR